MEKTLQERNEAKKVIFLDIDGVLNVEVFINAFWEFCRISKLKRTEAKFEACEILRDEFGSRFCPTACNMLKWIIEETNAKIVISSTWRMSGLKANQLMWEMRDLPGEIIDITPVLNTPRGEEISEWLRNNDVDSYVIIDDDKDMLFEQQPYFIQTNSFYGLTNKDAEKAIEILNVIQQPN